MMKKGLVLVIAATVLLSAVSGCKKNNNKSKNTIVAACAAEWPPMEMVNKKGEIVGFDVDLIRAIGKEEGFKVKMANSAWDGLFAGIESGEYDVIISCVTITDKRKKTMDFSAPYLKAGQIIVVRKETKGYNKLSDFKGKTLGAQIGTTGAFEIDKVKEITKRSYDDVGLAMADLANGRIMAVVCDYPIAANFALQKKKYKDSLKIIGKPFTSESVGIVVKKGNRELLDKINRGLKKVQKAGKIKKLEEKWLR